MVLRLILGAMLVAVLLLPSCQEVPETVVVCLPVNMTSTNIAGTETTKVIADFNYVPETGLLDHITWSNYQTHYFTYDSLDRLSVVKELKVKEKVQDERWFRYEGDRVSRIDLVRRNLDYIYLEPVDSTHTGYFLFDYEAGRVTGQHYFTLAGQGGQEKKIWEAAYLYDDRGNITTATTTDTGTGTETSESMTYDNSNHPFSNLVYYFSGESYVNNPLSKYVGEEDLEYTYDLELNGQGYPETIYEKVGSSNTRIIRYTYMCK